MWSRRGFLFTPAFLAGASKESAMLAIDGGDPVRPKPLRAGHFGPLYYDQSEWQQLLDVFKDRRPFRWYGMDGKPGMKVATFEREFAAKMQTKYALGVTCGTTALQTALAALETGPGDEVIIPAWTWHSCFNTVVLAGALPVCCEVDESFNMDPADIERHITPQTKVIMAVHLQGNPADMDKILAVARKHNLKVLEDCSQSVGASYKGHPLGSMGDIAMASLQVNKTISAGEGGAVYTNDPALYERALRFHDMGGFRSVHQDWIGKPQLDWFIGTNFRMTEFTGGVLLAQIRKLDKIVSDMRAVGGRVYDGIRDLPGLKLRHLPDPAGELASYVFLEFPTQEKRDRFMKAMSAENVPARPPGGSVILPTQPHIEKKVTVHPAWPSFNSPRGKSIRYGAASCPKTIDILSRFAGVGLDPKFSVSDTNDVVTAIRKVYPRIAAS